VRLTTTDRLEGLQVGLPEADVDAEFDGGH
jgi:hypothetical protein